MNIRYISVRPCAVENTKLEEIHENEHRTKSGNTATRGSRSIFINDTRLHRGNRGGRQRKHRTLTFMLHQEQDFLIFQLQRQISSRQFINPVRGASQRLLDGKRRRVGRIGHDSGSLFGQWSVWRSMGANARTTVGFHRRESSADVLQSTRQFHQLSGRKIMHR